MDRIIKHRGRRIDRVQVTKSKTLWTTNIDGGRRNYYRLRDAKAAINAAIARAEGR